MKKPLIVIQARLSSKRLPGKVLLPLAGRPMLNQIFRRCSAVKGAKVVVACPTADTEAIFTSTGIVPYGGPEQDLLTRLLVPLRALNCDALIRVTGDCPLVDPTMITDMVNVAKGGNTPIVTNTFPPRTYPNGMDLELYHRGFLEELDKSLEGAHREYFYSWCLANCGDHAFTKIHADNDASKIRLTVDYPEDLKLMEHIYKAQGKEIWPLRDILLWLFRNENRHLMNLNRKYENELGAKP